LKNDPEYLQGIPDLTILYNDKWALLEVKASADSDERPNQSHYVGVASDMSFAAFIYPENETEVLNDLESAFSARRSSRVSKRK